MLTFSAFSRLIQVCRTREDLSLLLRRTGMRSPARVRHMFHVEPRAYLTRAILVCNGWGD